MQDRIQHVGSGLRDIDTDWARLTEKLVMKNIFNMKFLPFTACALAALAGISRSASAENVVLTVTGTIIPASCTPTLGNGGVIDYGYIKADTLSATAFTTLASKSIDFSIACSGPVKVAITAVNGRPGTLAGAAESGSQSAGTSPVALLGFATPAVVGLGLDGTKKIGGYAIRVSPSTFIADTNAVVNIGQNSIDDPATWNTSNVNLYNQAAPYRKISWAATSTTVPVSFTNLAGKLDVHAYINKTTDLDITHAFALDGMTTIEIIYL